MSTAIFVACAAQKRELWVGPYRSLFTLLDYSKGRMDPRVATSHSTFAGCSSCFQQARLRSAPGGRRHVQIQCVEVKAPKGAEFGKESRIGKAPIKLPAGVSVKFDSDLLEVKVRAKAQGRLKSLAQCSIVLLGVDRCCTFLRQHVYHRTALCKVMANVQ